MGNCDGAFSTAENFADFWCLSPLSEEQKETITRFLEIAASDVHAALAASGACDCTLAPWALGYLGKLNLIDAAVIHNCPCGSARLEPEVRQSYIMWLTEQFDHIRKQDIELCDGQTGAEFPAAASAQRNYGAFSEAAIITRRERMR